MRRFPNGLMRCQLASSNTSCRHVQLMHASADRRSCNRGDTRLILRAGRPGAGRSSTGQRAGTRAEGRGRRTEASNWRTTLSHSITSSARPSSGNGTVRPGALAILRLITNLNLIGCSTGRSAGCSYAVRGKCRLRSPLTAKQTKEIIGSDPLLPGGST